jgi:hypothetical protein
MLPFVIVNFFHFTATLQKSISASIIWFPGPAGPVAPTQTAYTNSTTFQEVTVEVNVTTVLEVSV